MHRFLVMPSQINNGQVTIIEDEAKHLAKVLRLKIDDTIVVFDGNGNEYLCKLEEVTNIQARALIIEQVVCDREAPIEVWLVQGMPKGEKMDLVVQKATELGVAGIIPLMTERCVVQLDAKKRINRVERWQRIAEEAVKQCRRNKIPHVHEVTDWANIGKIIPKDSVGLVLWEEETSLGIKEKLVSLKSDTNKSIYLFIGPEGGLSEREVIQLKEFGVYPVTLGPRILRTETAGLAAIAVVLYELGDLGG